MIAIDLSEKQALDADPKATQKIDFTGNLERDHGVTMKERNHSRNERNHFRFFIRNY